MVGRALLLDSGPLGLASHTKDSSEALECKAWLLRLRAGGVRIMLPEVSDYEVRRELVRMRKTNAVRLLDQLAGSLEYLPLTTAAMRLAADLWADARRTGRPTAGAEALDGDVLLTAQARTLGVPTVVATANVAHIGRYTDAAFWRDIGVPP